METMMMATATVPATASWDDDNDNDDKHENDETDKEGGHEHKHEGARLRSMVRTALTSVSWLAGGSIVRNVVAPVQGYGSSSGISVFQSSVTVST